MRKPKRRKTSTLRAVIASQSASDNESRNLVMTGFTPIISADWHKSLMSASSNASDATWENRLSSRVYNE